MPYCFRPTTSTRWAFHRAANGTLVAGRAPARKPQQRARPRNRRMYWSITNTIVHRLKELHAERCRLEKHLGAAVAKRVLNTRSIVELRSIVDDVENA